MVECGGNANRFLAAEQMAALPPAAASPPPSDRSPRRPRIHRSTIVVMLLVAAILVLANVPGQVVVGPNMTESEMSGPWFFICEQYEHGWPLCYMTRDEAVGNPLLRLHVSPWDLPEGANEFSAARLVADIVATGALVILVAFAFEAWRRRRRRIWQFHVIDLMALVLLCSVVLGRLTAARRQYEREMQVLTHIDAARNRGEPTAWSAVESAEWQRGGPTWLRGIVGDRYFRAFDRVVGLDVSGDEIASTLDLQGLNVVRIDSRVKNSELKPLELLPHLQALVILDALVVSESEHANPDYSEPLELPRLPRLRGLNLKSTYFRGDGLEQSPHLEVLDLVDTGLDDTGMQQVGGLARLRVLYLGATGMFGPSDIGDAGLEHLSSLSQLEELSLTGAKVSDEGLRYLQDLRQLRSLSLDGCAITDEGLDDLTALENFEYLGLSETLISDEGLRFLKSLRKLKYVNLSRTQVTDAGVAELQKALPNCEIVR